MRQHTNSCMVHFLMTKLFIFEYFLLQAHTDSVATKPRQFFLRQNNIQKTTEPNKKIDWKVPLILLS